MSIITECDKSYLLETWRRKITAVESMRPMDDGSKLQLARVLENTKLSLRKEGLVRNGITQQSNITWFPDSVINMVSTLYASQICEELVSVQSIDNPLGRVVFLQYQHGDSRGDIIAGSDMIDRFGAMRSGDYKTQYASQHIDGESVNYDGKTGEVEAYLQNLPLLVDANHFIDFKSNVDAADVWRLKKLAENKFVLIALDANGYETGTDLLDSTVPVVVDQESGRIQFKAKNPLGAKGLNASYFQDLSSGPSMAGRGTLRLATEQIKAEPHKLRAQYVFDSGYGLDKSHGINIEECLVNACTTEIRHERDMEIINLLRRQAGSSIQWDSTNTSYISQREHNESFLQTLFAAASEISYKTKKVFGNWCVVGKRGLDTIMSVGAPRFQATGLMDLRGPAVVGTLDNSMKVIFSPYLDRSEFLVGYKGNDFMDAGFILADYLPIASTDWITLDDFVGRAGFVSVYGTKMVNNSMYVRGIIK